MNYKYYKDIPTTNHVWYKLVDKKNRLIQNYPDHICFAAIAHGFEKKATQINVYHDRARVPYDLACVKRWITDISEMGFPCTFAEDEESAAIKQEQFLRGSVAEGLEDMGFLLLRHGIEPDAAAYNFYINLNNYADKNHLFSTLSLIRCLTESGICRVPEEYFKLMDEDPARDKLAACQLAHKKVSKREQQRDPQYYANTGHMVTWDGNGDDITKDRLLSRFKKDKVDIRDSGYLSINAKWNGTHKD
jgi:hypothetical protein